MKRVISTALLTLVFAGNFLLAQNCGFGCLGMSGVYGGYSVQEYEAEGLNNFLTNSRGYGAESGMSFKDAEGFRVGANIFRADMDWLLLTAKGFYQFLTEENGSVPINNGVLSYRDNYVLETNYWGLGLDIGFPLFDFLDLKLIDGGITFLQIDFYDKQYENEIEIYNRKFENNDIDIGWYVGAGVIIHFVPDYISIEGTAGYNEMKVANLVDDDGQELLTNSIHGDFLTGGGFSATIQLNVGFPL